MRNALFGLALLTGITSTACNKTSESRTSGWGLESLSYGGTTLPVCFENRSVSDAALAGVTRTLLAHAQTEFEKTNLTLKGLSVCGPKVGSREIRLTWMDPDEFTSETAREGLEGMSQIGNGFIYGVNTFNLPQRVSSSVKAVPNMILNAHIFERYQKELNKSAAVTHFKSVLLHEIGHAVGMLHEHAQAKSNCNLGEDMETIKLHFKVWEEAGISVNQGMSEVVGTSYDQYSIMNYCYLFERSAAVAVGLSNKDIETINALYPKPESGGGGFDD